MSVSGGLSSNSSYLMNPLSISSFIFLYNWLCESLLTNGTQLVAFIDHAGTILGI